MRIGGQGPCKQQEHVVDGYNGKSSANVTVSLAHTGSEQKPAAVSKHSHSDGAKGGQAPQQLSKRSRLATACHGMPKHRRPVAVSSGGGGGGNTAVSPSPRLAC